MSQNNFAENVQGMYDNTVKERRNSNWWLRTGRGSLSSVGATVPLPDPNQLLSRNPGASRGQLSGTGTRPALLRETSQKLAPCGQRGPHRGGRPGPRCLGLGAEPPQPGLGQRPGEDEG